MPNPSNTTANRYGALAAEMYDIDKGVGSLHDPAFHLARLAGIEGPMLEPACGSGRALIPMLEAATTSPALYDIPPMVAAAAVIIPCRLPFPSYIGK